MPKPQLSTASQIRSRRRANSVQAECILSVLANKSELISSTFANLASWFIFTGRKRIYQNKKRACTPCTYTHARRLQGV